MSVQHVDIEIWDKAKQRIADITGLVTPESRAISLKLNGIDTIQFSMDLDRFEAHCASIGMHPRNLLWPLNTDIIVKLDGTPWKGFEVVAVTPYLNESSTTLSVRGEGFLSLFSSRYLTKNYLTPTEVTSIAADMINTTQAQTNGTFGVTIGAQQYVTGVQRTRTYENQNIRDGLVALTRLETGQFDMNITYDKKFETYAMLGALKSDTPLIYGDGGNIKSVEVPTEGSTVANRVTGLGSGFGPDQIRATSVDALSQLAYGVREALPQWNSVEDLAELQENADAYVASTKTMLQIPRIVVTSNEVTLSTSTPGDRYPVSLAAHAFTDNVKGLQRAIEMGINFDENDFADIALTFDDLGVDQNESS